MNVPSRTELKIFAVILGLLTIFAACRMFTIPTSQPTQHSTHSGKIYTVTNKDFGKILTIHKGDTLILSLMFSDTNRHSISIKPQGILKQTTQTGMTLIAQTPGTAIVTITSQPTCAKKQICPQIILVNFRLAVTVL